MRKNRSYVRVTDKDVKHPIIKKLLELGFKNITLFYASHWATDSGWTIVECDMPKGWVGEFDLWLGYTKTGALKRLNELK